jgi:hypothetical protein
LIGINKFKLLKTYMLLISARQGINQTIMKHLITLFFTSLVILTNTNAFGQTDLLKSQVDSLKYLSGDPFDCNFVTWRIIENKKEAIQILIEKIEDTTLTNTTDKCKTTNLRVGDLAYLTLKRILPLPFFAVTRMQCDVIKDGCLVGVFEYIDANRTTFKGQVQTYYDKKKDNLKWRQLDRNHLTPCHIQNNIKGQYK